MRKPKSLPFKSKSTFAIVVDGECEVWYFQMLKRNERLLTVNIEPRIPHRKKLSEQYKSVLNFANDYTKVFWIIDFDVILSETKKCKKGDKSALQEFLEYKKVISKNHDNIVVIINNPCLEFWLLLHFEKKSKPFNNCSSVENRLKTHLKDYEKTRNYYTKQNHDIYLKLKSKLNDALSNSKTINTFNSSNPEQSICEMHLLFETSELKQILKKH